MKRSTKINIVCCAFILGIVSAKIWQVALLIIAMSWIYAVLNRGFVSLILIFLCLGNLLANFDMARQHQMADESGDRITIVGRVRNDPVFDKRKASEFYLDKIIFQGKSIPGIMRISTYDRSIERFDQLEVSGKLGDGFGPYFASIRFASTEVLSKDSSSVEHVRNQVINRLNQELPNNSASMTLGFLVGLRSSIDQAVLDNLRVSGLTHIIAVSGYNLTILVQLVRRLFEKISRKISLVLSMGFLIGFTLIAERTPSIERALVVTVLSLLAWYWGRSSNGITVLMLSALITLALNPLYVFNSVSWYLSFAAFWGVLYLAPAITSRFKNPPKLIGSIAIETSCAQIATLPIILFVFGEFSSYGLLANIIVLPIVPLVMLTGFLSFAVPWINHIFAGATHLLILFIENVSLVISFLPGARNEVYLSSATIGIVSIVIVFWGYSLRRVQLKRQVSYND